MRLYFSCFFVFWTLPVIVQWRYNWRSLFDRYRLWTVTVAFIKQKINCIFTWLKRQFIINGRIWLVKFIDKLIILRLSISDKCVLLWQIASCFGRLNIVRFLVFRHRVIYWSWHSVVIMYSKADHVTVFNKWIKLNEKILHYYYKKLDARINKVA